MTALARALTRIGWEAVGGDRADLIDDVVFTGSGALASAFPVTDLACATIAAAALSIAEFVHAASGIRPNVSVDRRISSIWFKSSIRPIGWTLPAPWDPIAGDYRARDGWIRLHTNVPRHRAAVETLLGAQVDKETTAQAVSRWAKTDLETAVVAAGGCAAEMRSIAEWRQHPQGRAVASEALVQVATFDRGEPPKWRVHSARPLAGLRVLDLTRVLAGPVATRFLAGYGADVLRLDPPDWNEPNIVPEMTLGKRCARLDLRDPDQHALFAKLLSGANVLVHGYRPDALDALGFDAKTRRKIAPGLVDVCLDAYGWSGPWARRRGFDSLVQMSAGIAHAGMQWRGTDQPSPLPVQAVDHATGYLMAATAVRALTRRLTQGNGTEARLSLARTAKLLADHRTDSAEPSLAPESASDRSDPIETTDWGPAQRIAPPVRISGIPMTWDQPARDLGSAAARWCDE